MSVDDVISASELNAWDVVFAVVTLIVTWVVFRVSHRATRAAVGKLSGVSENLRLVIVRVVKYLVLFMGIGVALSFLGAQIQPVLVVVVILAALAFLALRGVADNFGAGIVLQSRKPITTGDEIESQGFVGTVISLNARSVVIVTTDGRTVHLPNADVLDEPLVNNTQHGRRRSEVEVRCALHKDDQTAHTAQLARVSGLLCAATASTTNVHATPGPAVLMLTIEPARATMLVRYWTDPDVYVATSSSVLTAIGAALAESAVHATVTSQRPDPPLTTPPAV